MRIIRWALFLLGVLVCWLAVSCPPDAPKRPDVILVDESIFSRTILLNLAPEEERKIKRAILIMLSQQCTDKFEEAGLKSPLEVITTTGIVIRPDVDLRLHSRQQLGIVYERTRRQLLDEFSSGRAQGGTVYPRRNGWQLTTDARPIIFLHPSAFWGNSFWLGTWSLHDVLIHEFIHAGGQPPTPGRFYFGHDLSGFEFYKEIMKSCR